MIKSEGYVHDKENPKLKVILFGELFNVRPAWNHHFPPKLKSSFFIQSKIVIQRSFCRSNRFTPASMISLLDYFWELENINSSISKVKCYFNVGMTMYQFLCWKQQRKSNKYWMKKLMKYEEAPAPTHNQQTFWLSKEHIHTNDQRTQFI